MKVMFFAYIRDYTKCKEVNIEDCGTVLELLSFLCKKYGNRFEDRVFEDGNLSTEIIILINGRHINHLNGVNTAINKDDEVCIFPVVAGG